jgi:hypothetical protein
MTLAVLISPHSSAHGEDMHGGWTAVQFTFDAADPALAIWENYGKDLLHDAAPNADIFVLEVRVSASCATPFHSTPLTPL